MKPAPIDRRVAVQTNTETSVQPLSRLRDKPYVVLLGEPGIGKSTSLQREAAAEGGELLTCREVMNGVPLAGSGTAYLDALDEYRSGDNGKDKLLQLANAISASGITRWRLTCRAEDWRDVADLKAMRRAAKNELIVLAHLLPLDEDEAQTILEALGAPNPRIFVEEAIARGASAFLESPLSLRLLHSVVLSNDIWPTSRFELFDKAIWALAHEHDLERATDPRPSPEAIVEAASIICFYILATGAKALWRSNTLPPKTASNEYVSIHSLGLESSVTASALDTAIFRGEGHIFEPIHKTVSEFLAAQFLAKKVAGTSNSSSFPLRRATALITGNDHKAPSELRGLYAWFAAHLHNQGDPAGALQLIERDAATVLAYGDAAAFDTAGRKSILFNLDQEDPYFLTSQRNATVFGGLAGEDLAEDFISILDAEVRSQLQITVLQALADGPPVAGVNTKLREIALESNRPFWMRERAAEVLIKTASDQSAAGRILLNELNAMPISPDQAAIRTQILTRMPADAMIVQEIRQLLSDFNTLPAPSNDDEIDKTGSLTSLAIALQRSPLSDLFDAPIIKIRGGDHQQKYKVRSFLYQALAAAIEANANIKADRLWTWIKNARENTWDMLDSNVVEAVQSWIDRDTDRRELDLFVTLLNDSSPDEKPWVVSNHYTSIVRRLPSEAVINGLIELAKAQNKGRKRKRLFQVVAYVARSEPHWSIWRDEIVSILRQEYGFIGFTKSLLSDPNKQFKKKEAQRKAINEAKTEAARSANITSLTPKLAAITNGNASESSILIWASNHYRNAVISKKQDPLEKVKEFTNKEIAAAIAEGFIQFSIHTNIKVSIADLGKVEAENRSYRVEYVIAAGLHQALLHGREGDIAACPLIVGIVGLRHSYFSGDDKPSIASWAVHRLAQDSDQGAEEILWYWNAALDAGDDDLDAIHHLSGTDEQSLLSKCLQGLLNVRPNLPVLALSQALKACTTVLTSGEMISLVTRTVERDDLDMNQRDMWSFAAMALMPTKFANGLSEEECQAALLAPDGELAKVFDELCPQPEELDRMRIVFLGKTNAADEDDWRHSGSASGIIRSAIRRLSASKNPDAGGILKSIAPDIHPSWQPQLTHSAAEHARNLRDEHYVRPSVSQLNGALSGGPPASPQDLVAVILEEIERYQRTLRSGSEMPWKRFWNTDKNGAATTPQIENEDRDRLLELFRIRFEKYGVAASLPEARRGENTRADVLLLSHAGNNLPIEAKRHYNNELWTAPLDQLAGYASDEGAFGFGVYLVFWFGTEFKVPTRKDGTNAPTSACELKKLLVNDLSPTMKSKLEVVVLDVSRPATMIAKGAKRKKKKR